MLAVRRLYVTPRLLWSVAVLLMTSTVLGADDSGEFEARAPLRQEFAVQQLEVDLSFLQKGVDLERQLLKALGEPTVVRIRRDFIDNDPTADYEIHTWVYGDQLQVEFISDLWLRTTVWKTYDRPLALGVRMGEARADVVKTFGIREYWARDNPILIGGYTPDRPDVSVGIYFDDMDHLTRVEWTWVSH